MALARDRRRCTCWPSFRSDRDHAPCGRVGVGRSTRCCRRLPRLGVFVRLPAMAPLKALDEARHCWARCSTSEKRTGARGEIVASARATPLGPGARRRPARARRRPSPGAVRNWSRLLLSPVSAMRTSWLGGDATPPRRGNDLNMAAPRPGGRVLARGTGSRARSTRSRKTATIAHCTAMAFPSRARLTASSHPCRRASAAISGSPPPSAASSRLRTIPTSAPAVRDRAGPGRYSTCGPSTRPGHRRSHQ